MSSPVSVPAVPPQPNQAVYGFQELALFKSYTRESYRAAFGVEPPPWDPSRLKKTWFDSTADMKRGTATAEYLATRADEPNFLPDGHLPIIITREHVLLG